jgi:hypothetical protein
MEVHEILQASSASIGQNKLLMRRFPRYVVDFLTAKGAQLFSLNVKIPGTRELL